MCEDLKHARELRDEVLVELLYSVYTPIDSPRPY